ncbi:MAG: metallophosphoesterase family protein, partial [Nitrosotalea sp.]
LCSNLIQFSNKINSREFVDTINQTTDILKKERSKHSIQNSRIEEDCLWMKIPENLVIIGDIHGDIESLHKILDEINFEIFLTNKNNKLVFLGDYIDRGSNSIAVLYTICKIKQTYPNSVVLMRGNHEASEEFPFQSYDLPQSIEKYFGSNEASKIHSQVLEFFRLLTVMVIIENHLLMVHGGLPVYVNEPMKEMCFPSSKNKTLLLLEELLWNDPRIIDSNTNWEISRRPYGKHFGIAITQKWLDITQTKVVVRGHEPCMGYRIDHNQMILTLFSCKEPYPKFETGYLYIKNNELSSIKNALELSRHVRKTNVRN